MMNSRQFSMDTLNEDQINILESEEAGQLYVYRYNDTTAVLATRSASLLGANIGIGSIASGRYQCRAQNQNNATAKMELSISVSSE